MENTPTGQMKVKTTPKDFFLYIGVMALLYGSVFSLINLLFDYINYAFPDPLSGGYDPYSDSIRWAIAFLIIIFPAFVTGSWYVLKDLRAHPEKLDIGIRKWLTYLTLFIAGAGILVDLSVLIYTFLGGEITSRFTLKVLVILIIASYVLYYYLLDLRGKIRENPKLGKTFVGIASAAVLISIVGGFFVVGSPSTQRAMRFDQQRVGDLQNIQWQVINYWQRKEVLPTTLQDLNDPIANYVVPKDPDTNESYIYKTIGVLSFQLCANFSRPSISGTETTKAVPVYPGGIDYETENWKHGTGEGCFSRNIDPKLYPPIKGGGR